MTDEFFIFNVFETMTYSAVADLKLNAILLP